MRLLFASLFLTFGVGQAAAFCASDSTTVLGCTIGNGAKQLDVCITGYAVTYRFGPKDPPDLTLTAPIHKVRTNRGRALAAPSGKSRPFAMAHTVMRSTVPTTNSISPAMVGSRLAKVTVRLPRSPVTVDRQSWASLR